MRRMLEANVEPTMEPSSKWEVQEHTRVGRTIITFVGEGGGGMGKGKDTTTGKKDSWVSHELVES